MSIRPSTAHNRQSHGSRDASGMESSHRGDATLTPPAVSQNTSFHDEPSFATAGERSAHREFLEAEQMRARHAGFIMQSPSGSPHVNAIMRRIFGDLQVAKCASPSLASHHIAADSPVSRISASRQSERNAAVTPSRARSAAPLKLRKAIQRMGTKNTFREGHISTMRRKVADLEALNSMFLDSTEKQLRGAPDGRLAKSRRELLVEKYGITAPNRTQNKVYDAERERLTAKHGLIRRKSTLSPYSGGSFSPEKKKKVSGCNTRLYHANYVRPFSAAVQRMRDGPVKDGDVEKMHPDEIEHLIHRVYSGPLQRARQMAEMDQKREVELAKQRKMGALYSQRQDLAESDYLEFVADSAMRQCSEEVKRRKENLRLLHAKYAPPLTKTEEHSLDEQKKRQAELAVRLHDDSVRHRNETHEKLSEQYANSYRPTSAPYTKTLPEEKVAAKCRALYQFGK